MIICNNVNFFNFNIYGSLSVSKISFIWLNRFRGPVMCIVCCENVYKSYNLMSLVMRTALWGFHMAHLGSTSLFGLYLAMGGVLAPSQRQCVLGWGVLTHTPAPSLAASYSSAGNFRCRNNDWADDNWKCFLFWFVEWKSPSCVYISATVRSESKCSQHRIICKLKITTIKRWCGRTEVLVPNLSDIYLLFLSDWVCG